LIRKLGTMWRGGKKRQKKNGGQEEIKGKNGTSKEYTMRILLPSPKEGDNPGIECKHEGGGKRGRRGKKKGSVYLFEKRDLDIGEKKKKQK